jgi:malonate-semialdehyde dehydrogenase (acetylating)/methylmalonate-semialdehyde dehydrogenase
MGGAKNHGIVLPDADLEHAVADIVGAAFGSRGERCMALPVVVPVGDATADELRRRLVAAIGELRVGASTDAGVHYGPVVSGAHKARIAHYIQAGRRRGRRTQCSTGADWWVAGLEGGFFLGPSLFDHVREDMHHYREEIFGPMLQIVRAESFEHALALPSRHQYGNGVAIFTRNGEAAREFAGPGGGGHGGHQRADSRAGGVSQLRRMEALRVRGSQPVRPGRELRFYTRTKTITQRWPKGAASNEHSFVIPTMALML